MPVSKGKRTRLPPLERIVAVSSGEKVKAYPFTILKRRGVVEDRVEDQRFVIF